jgi:hypothetical protein
MRQLRIYWRRLVNWWRIPKTERVTLVREHYLDEWRGDWR